MSETYLGNKNLKSTDVQVEYTPDQIKEYLKCARDPVYFVKKYVKIVHVDMGLVNFELWPFQEEMVGKFNDNRFVICKLPRQVGKALDINTDIPTPVGWKKMKDLSVGDEVFDMHGMPTKITFKSETHHKDTFRITFSDNTSVVACKDHLWYGYNYHGTNKFRTEMRTFSTQDIWENGVFLYNSKKEFRYSIPLCSSVIYEEKALPIDPYVLGLWLGDGSSNNGTITILENDFEDIKKHIPYGYTIKRYDKKNSSLLTVKIEGLYTLLGKNNLLGNKHIPELYLQGSIEQRRRLLAGLLDTDGTVTKYSVSFTQALFRKSLVDQVRELISSLGYKVSEYIYRSEHPSITIRFTSQDVKSFLLTRKANKQKLAESTKTKKKQIVNIEKIDTCPTQCIEVDSPTHTFLCTKDYIVTHNTTTVAAYILWKILFTEQYSVAILANKMTQAKEILGRIQMAYEWLPKWLQQGIVEWNKGNIRLENGSEILASATSSNAIRGTSQNLVYLDEFAFVPNNLQEEFFASVFPTISSGTTTKVIITSTPNGMNLFHRIWIDSLEERNSYIRQEVHWSDVPGRDIKWKEETIKNTSEEQFRQEFECEFLGSTNTLISPAKLFTLVHRTPLYRKNNFDCYVEPIKKHNYLITVDTGRGVDGDYSAFVVMDITEFPYKVVGKYRSKTISPLLYPDVIHNVALMYNKAHILVEINDIGETIATTLHYDLEYENILSTNVRAGDQEISGGFSNRVQLGVRTTKSVKRLGCSNLKDLVETDKLLIPDYDVIQELSTFISKGSTYMAEEGHHDDLVMCLVLFAWLVRQDYFIELSNTDLRKRHYEENLKMIEDDVLPFGLIDDGRGEDNNVEPVNHLGYELYR